MKIIFLDFDGVILTLRTCVAHDKPGWSNAAPDPVLVNVLRRCGEAGVEIVVSSTWRTHEASCHAKLRECDLQHYLHADWRTIEKHMGEVGTSRPTEIAEWLSRHPEIEDYRILDDDAWWWTQDSLNRDTQCVGIRSPNHKLTEELVRAIREAWGQSQTAPELSNRFGVHQKTVWQVVRRQSWRHVV